MRTAFRVFVVSATVFICLLAALLNPGLGVLFVLLAVLTGIYAVRRVVANVRRKRLRKNTGTRNRLGGR